MRKKRIVSGYKLMQALLDYYKYYVFTIEMYFKLTSYRNILQIILINKFGH